LKGTGKDLVSFSEDESVQKSSRIIPLSQNLMSNIRTRSRARREEESIKSSESLIHKKKDIITDIMSKSQGLDDKNHEMKKKPKIKKRSTGKKKIKMGKSNESPPFPLTESPKETVEEGKDQATVTLSSDGDTEANLNENLPFEMFDNKEYNIENLYKMSQIVFREI